MPFLNDGLPNIVHGLDVGIKIGIPVNMESYKGRHIHVCWDVGKTELGWCDSTIVCWVQVYQFFWFSCEGQTTNFGSHSKKRFPHMWILKTSKPWIQESMNFCFFPNPWIKVPAQYIVTNIATYM